MTCIGVEFVLGGCCFSQGCFGGSRAVHSKVSIYGGVSQVISTDFLALVRVECAYIWCNSAVEGIVFAIRASREECWMHLGSRAFPRDALNVLLRFVDEQLTCMWENKRRMLRCLSGSANLRSSLLFSIS